MGAPLGLLGLYMRMKPEETPAFRAYAEEADKRDSARPGLGALFRVHWPQLLKCVGLMMVFNITDLMLLTCTPSFLSVTMGFAERNGLLLIIIVMLVMMPSLFYTPVRYSALSIAFNLSVSLFGGSTPLVPAWLVERIGDPLVPADYLMGAAVIGIITMLFVTQTAGLPLRGSPPAVASDAEARAWLRSDALMTVDDAQPTLPEVMIPDHERLA